MTLPERFREQQAVYFPFWWNMEPQLTQLWHSLATFRLDNPLVLTQAMYRLEPNH
jgi:hypothetical protein